MLAPLRRHLRDMGRGGLEMVSGDFKLHERQ